MRQVVNIIGSFSLVAIFGYIIFGPPSKSVQEVAGLDQYTRADMCLRLRDFSLKMWDTEVQAMCRAALADHMREHRATWDRDWQKAQP